MGTGKPPPAKNNNKECVLSPFREKVEITGPMTYNESAQAWNIIRLRKDILHEFPELKDKRTAFGYKLVIPRNPEALKKIIEESAKSENTVPIFLSFAKVAQEDKQ